MTLYWQGYEQHPDAVPERPWWHGIVDPQGGLHANRGDFRIEVSWYWDRIKVEQFTDELVTPIADGWDMSFPGRSPAPFVEPGTPCWQVLFESKLHRRMWDHLTREESRATVMEHGERWMERIDSDYPRPRPPCRCGQVWVWPHPMGVSERVVVGVEDGYGFFQGEKLLDTMQRQDADWWKKSAMLVAGQGAPWAPSAKKEEA